MNKRIALSLLLACMLLSGCQGPAQSVCDKPLIGITSVYSEDRKTTEVNVAYVDAVLNSGGIPVILPAVDSEEAIGRYIDELDGLVLVGGRDIPPSMYGQKPHETVRLIPERRLRFDAELIARWMASGKPILGVCLGMQFTNVVMGGTLIQDIPSQVGTDVTHHKAYHQVTIDPTSKLAEILGDESALVYSYHHQAVDRIATGLKPVAHAHDGVVEALERTDAGQGLFIQWHPEAMADKYPEHTKAIYGYLVSLCLDTHKRGAVPPNAETEASSQSPAR